MYYLMRRILIATVLLLAYLAALVVYLVPNAWLVSVALGIVMLFRRTHRYTAYGTARWADASDIPHLLEGRGLMVGHIEGKPGKVRGMMALFDRDISAKAACQKFLLAFQRKPPKYLVRLTKAVHSMIVAPVGVGKSTGVAIPFLLTCDESVVVVDFKGELSTITAAARRRMGHKVVILDPFKIVTPEPDTFNPLQFIDKESPTALDECRDLAEALVIRTGQEKEPFWNDSAEVWIAAMTAAVACFTEGEEKSLQTVRALLTNPDKMQVVALDPRVAITFTPGVPPIWTRLVRYYEKGFGQPTGLSPAKMAFDTACLFLAAAILAAIWTAGLFTTASDERRIPCPKKAASSSSSSRPASSRAWCSRSVKRHPR
jgi:type IV secretion system protein VirD4